MSDGPASIGSVSVSVVPDARGFVDRLKPQLDADAKVIGNRIGAIIGEQIAKQIGDKTRNAPIGPDDTKARERGSKTAGAFADGFKARLEAAIKSLPPIQIGVASSEADQKLKDIQFQLRELADKRVGIDITDEQAVAKLTELRAQLADLHDSAGSIQVKADTARALAELDKIKAEVDKLDGKKVDVDVDVDDHGSAEKAAAKVEEVGAAGSNAGSGGVSFLGAGLLQMGALAVAGADIAIPAILAVGAAAASAVAGIAVLGLGFHGVFDAINAANQPKVGGAGRIAGAGLSEQSAQLQAQQATQQAQDQLTQATQDHQNAVTALAKAQRDAKTAQTDLTLARVQAKQAIEDLDNSVKDNALNQQQAAIKLAEAKRTLAIMLASPGASLPQYANQIAQARLDVEVAQQKSNELQQQGQRLAAQDRQAHKAGVEGSKAVVDAKNKVTDANVAVLQAQQKLVDSSHKLAEAQANIGITAQKNAIALQQAALGMQSAAMGANQFGQAMAKLNPIQQQFVEFWLKLKPLMNELTLAASGFFPGLEKGITSALPAFQPLLRVVSAVAKALGDVFTSIGKALAGPDGQKFLAFLATEMPKQIIFLGQLFVGFGKVVANIWEQAAPLIDAFDKVILNLLNHLANNKGLQSFFDGLAKVMPSLGQALGSLGGAIGTALAAIVPALGPTLDLFATLFGTFGQAIKAVIPSFSKAWGDLLKAVTPLIPVFGKIIEAILPPLIGFLDQLVKQGVGPLVEGIASALLPLLPTLSQNLIDLALALAPFIVQLVQAIIPMLPQFADLLLGLMKQVTPLIPEFGQFLKALTPLLKPLTDLAIQCLALVTKSLPFLQPLIVAITKALPYLTPLVKDAADFMGHFYEAISRVVGWLNTLVDAVKGTGLASAFSQMFSGVKTVWSDVSSFFYAVINGIIDGIDGLISTLDRVKINVPTVHIPGTNVNIGGGTLGFNIPLIPHVGNPGTSTPRPGGHGGPQAFAEGGLVPATPGGRLVRVAEAGQAEVIAPFDKFTKMLGLTGNGKGGRRPVTQNIFTSDPLAAANAAAVRLAARAV